MDVERIGVVGCGLMGSGIAEVCAKAGRDVVVLESDGGAADAGWQRIESSLRQAVRREKLTEEEAAATSHRIHLTSNPGDLSDRQMVVEAVPETEELKLATFRLLDEVIADENAVLATNTSSIPIMKLAMATSRPERVIGIHFFNPVPVLPLVEIVPSLLTAPDVIELAERIATKELGKQVIRSQDRAGFIVNALLVPYVLAAVRMLESGFASAADIDSGMVQGCAHPMGPLALADLIGIDTVAAIAQSMYEEFKEPLYSPPPMVLRMVDAGLLGRKSGRGFHQYS
jgi:3-hydroxybutyryl-CoA dehydrogenase